jgi:hypothetical protein
VIVLSSAYGSSLYVVKSTDVVSEIRSILNLPSAQELSDAVILNAISRADTYINGLARRSSADPDIVVLAKRNYAAFLAYQAYSDRVLNDLPGSYNSEGIWTPIGDVIQRETASKLKLLRETANAAIRQIIAYGPTGRLVRPGWLMY